ncbi:MAG TPA: squalene/phytoene synthase family protein [Rhodopila sp.]
MNEAIAALVRRHDPDRFLTALFAPPERRDALLTLYAFNHELARAREVASEPPLALIRLQWWREVVEGEPKRHEIASPLSEVIAGCPQVAADLEAMIDVREREVETGFATVDHWRDAVLSGGGSLAVAAARVLGAPEPEAFRRFGAAYVVAGQVRAMRYLAARSQCLLPRDLLACRGLTIEAAIAEPEAPGVREVLSALVREGVTLVREGQAMLGRGSADHKAARAAALPASLARRDFARWHRRPGSVVLQRGFGDKLAVVRAAFTGHL